MDFRLDLAWNTLRVHQRGHKLLQQINLEVSLVTYAANPMAKVEWVKQQSFDVAARLASIAEKVVNILSG